MKKIKIGKIVICTLVCSLCVSQITYVNAAETTNSKVIRVSNDIRLQDDFYRAVNKNWLNSAEIKEGLPINSTIMEINEIVNTQKKAIITDLLSNERNYSQNSNEKKIINLYKNAMNTEERNQQGIKPIKKMLDDINNIRTLDDLTKSYGDPEISNKLLQFVYTVADRKDATKYALYIDPTALSLDDADEYLKPTEESEEKKKATENYYMNLLKLVGYTEDVSKKKVDNIFKLQNMLAPSLYGEAENEANPNILDDMYNVYTLDQLSASAPNLNLKEILKELKIDNAHKIVVEQPKWLKTLNDIYTPENLQLMKDYIEIMSIDNAAEYLGDEFQTALEKYRNECVGTQGQSTKEENAGGIVDEFLGMPLGKIYVEKYFKDKSKYDVKEMTDELIDNYKKRINNLDWMSDKTKQNAINKLNTLSVKVGYPDKWEDYSNVEVKSYEEGGSLWENVLKLNNFELTKERSEINENVDKEDFDVYPQIVNAWYSPETNSITIPAGILQGKVYDPNASKEANLGGIGAIIAHEITHALDNNGSQYDSDGNLKNWWTDEDKKKFEEKTNKVKDFYDKIKAENGQNVNGTLTLGENIADISGVACTLDLLNKIPNADYKTFFESYTNRNREIYTEVYEENMLKYNPHAPAEARVNAVLSQFEEFYKTYGVKEGDKMYVKPEERLKIW